MVLVIIIKFLTLFNGVLKAVVAIALLCGYWFMPIDSIIMRFFEHKILVWSKNKGISQYNDYE